MGFLRWADDTALRLVLYELHVRVCTMSALHVCGVRVSHVYHVWHIGCDY